ncbi:hypothetical protein V8C42DRAFT_185848 [Trichoderma barbatum]
MHGPASSDQVAKPSTASQSYEQRPGPGSLSAAAAKLERRHGRSVLAFPASSMQMNPASITEWLLRFTGGCCATALPAVRIQCSACMRIGQLMASVAQLSRSSYFVFRTQLTPAFSQMPKPNRLHNHCRRHITTTRFQPHSSAIKKEASPIPTLLAPIPTLPNPLPSLVSQRPHEIDQPLALHLLIVHASLLVLVSRFLLCMSRLISILPHLLISCTYKHTASQIRLSECPELANKP